MKLISKKLYWNSRNHPVSSKELKNENNTSALCSSCNELLYSWAGAAWKYVGEGS